MDARRSSEELIIIGVAGASGSGKTSTVEALLKYYGPDQCIKISTDNYYLGAALTPEDIKANGFYDNPGSIESSLLAENIRTLISGKVAYIPNYDFATHSRKEEKTPVNPAGIKILIIEGILALHFEELKDLFDIKVFVEANLEVCFERRKERDMAERGRTLEDIERQWNEEVLPMFKQFVKPCEATANVVVHNTVVSLDAKKKVQLDVNHLIAYLNNFSKNAEKSEEQVHFDLYRPVSPEVKSTIVCDMV